MICYRGKTWCSFHLKCDHPCERALTDQVKADAKKWWGSDKAPICQFTDKPECFKEKKND